MSGASEHPKTQSSAELVAEAVFRTEVRATLKQMEASISALTIAVKTITDDQDEFTKQLYAGCTQFRELENADKAIVVRVAAVEAAQAASAATKHNIGMMIVDKLIGTVLPWAAIGTLLFSKGVPHG